MSAVSSAVETPPEAPIVQIAFDRLPLVVGVTGHRDIKIADEAPLRAAFANALSEFATICPATQLLVVSGLAAGADIMAAEEAIAQGWPVLAALPMPIDMYEHDFTEKERARFRAALAKCARVTIVATPDDRRTGYVATGLFLAHYSHVLVSFWDGLPGRGDGGTADVVRARLSGSAGHIDDIATIPYLPDIGPVYHIVTPHGDSPSPPDAFGIHRIYPKRYKDDPSVEEDLAAALKHYSGYNEDLRKYAPLESDATLRSFRDRTDAVAGRLQRTTKQFLIGLYVVGFFGAAIQVAHIQVFNINYQLLKIVALAVTFISYILARRFDYENRYQDYRALAEGLRVQEAWHCAGLGREWVDTCYLRMQQSELQWIRMALRCAYLLFCEDEAHAEPCPGHSVCKEWIDGQWAYYKNKTVDQANNVQRVNKISSLAFMVGVVFAIVSVALLYTPNLHGLGAWLHALEHGALPPKPYPPPAFAWAPWMLGVLQQGPAVPIALAAVLGTLLWQWGEHRSYAPNARRYHRMYVVFDHARTRLQELGSERTSEAIDVIRELGREALIEHADWLLTRRDRPISVAHI